MSSLNNVSINFFLSERKNRFSADEANKLKLGRIEKIDFSGTLHLADNKTTQTDMILIRKGDLVISGINVEKGAIAVYDGEEDVLATIHYSSYSFDEHKIDIGYFKWFLKSKFFKDIVNSSVRGGIKTELKPKHFLVLIIPLPSLNVQIEIRKKLDSVKAEIEELMHLDYINKAYVQKLRQAILQEGISGKLVLQNYRDEPESELLKKISNEKDQLIREKKIKQEKPLPPISREEIPFDLPNGWEWVRLGTIASLITKGSSPRWQGVNYVEKNEGILFITSENVGSYKIDLTNEKYVEKKFNVIEPRSILKNGDFLMNIVGASIGRTAIFNLSLENVNINQAVCLIRLCGNFLNKDYLLYFFNSDFCISNMYDKQVEMARPNLSMGNISKFLVPLPPFPEQQRIVQKIDALRRLCDEMKQNIQHSQKNSECLMESVLKEALAS